MATDRWLTIAGYAVLILFLAVATVVVCYLFIFLCNIEIKEWWNSQRMRLFRLGGVTTLSQRLGYRCTLCQDSMEAGDKVRTLSCDHVFHCGGTVKCELGIDQWLLTGEAMSWQSCPICRQVPHPVRLWKRPPPSSSPAPAPAPEPSAPALAQAQLPPTSTPGLEEAARDEIPLPEESSSQ